jgi:hypothetical protein
MIFSVQRFLEDYFSRRGLRDVDQYAVSLANLYERKRRPRTDKSFLESAHRIRTVFYGNNRELNRLKFEKSILAVLDGQFKKKAKSEIESFPGGLSQERRELKQRARLTISSLLDRFKRAVESRAVDSFWVSRKAGELRPRPERIGQALLAVFAKGVLAESGLVWREIFSGIGFIDVVVVLSRIPHLIELKIMKGRYNGAAQLRDYMKRESRRTGWLILFDARPQGRKYRVPARVAGNGSHIRNIIVEINPIAPSRLEA